MTTQLDAFAEFLAFLVEELDLEDLGPITADTTLADLEFDSLQTFAFLVVMEEAGCDIPEGLLAHLVTVGDCWDLYRLRIDQAVSAALRAS